MVQFCLSLARLEQRHGWNNDISSNLNPHWGYKNTRSVVHSSLHQILPNYPSAHKPRTITYIAKHFKSLVTISRNSPNDADLQILSIVEGGKEIQPINIYNEGNTCEKTTTRSLFTTSLHPQSLLIGDFNSHHPSWGHFNEPSLEAEELYEWFEDNNFELANGQE
ncbi:uncharacterized protein EAE97_005782 [Botrytis byssoidea]|uniref:Endonuclease/exonuclease/phosphatase domain-containing protein n=1 Tax=Botrytis byssoidea TaxID=139641 RepID=A0A9P5IQ11_9HELO|nr:uncharacterized protein EAE97_005782 [Botrytis byssoidea]KAF7943712.1 hypothetical protein EAE97_005782 [Botrytis byssoidea]